MEEYDIVEETLYGTTCITYYKKGTKIYHRLDGPAIELSTGSKSWYVNGKCHRIDGPAIQYHWGGKVWYIDGIRLSPEKENIMNLWYENGKI